MIRATTLAKLERQVGKKYGRLTVLKIAGRDPKHQGHYFVLCKCQCGTEKEVRINSIQYGGTKSCGCLFSEQPHRFGNTYRRLKYGEGAFNGLYASYRRGAAARALPFVLTQEQFKKITKQPCYYCDSPPSCLYKPKNGFGDYVFSGVDRIDSSKGYIFANCVSCCKRCNSLKNGITKEMVRRLYLLLFPIKQVGLCPTPSEKSWK